MSEQDRELLRREVLQALGVSAGAALASGTVSAEDLDAAADDDPLEAVEILTDEYDVSHVYADSLYGLGYGNGYVQCRDRLFQLDVFRHVARGNSAEVVGPGQLPSDIQVRRDLYSPGEIEDMWEDASETAQELVNGFVDGVNRRLAEMAASGELPAEFGALGHAPEPWTPEDTTAVIAYQIGVFGIGGASDIDVARQYAALAEELPDDAEAWDALEDLNWLRVKEDHYTTIPREEKTVDGGEDVPDFEDVPDEQLRYAKATATLETWGIGEDVNVPDSVTTAQREAHGVLEGFKWGSNCLLLSGEHSETGKPIMWGGPQMGKFKPPVPYEIGLHGAGYDCVGMGVPGTPTIVIGRSETMSWSITSGYDNQVDTVAVDLHPEDRHRYEWGGEYHEMDVSTVTHKTGPVGSALAGEARVVEQEVARIEENGDSMPVVAWNPEERVAYCQRITTRFDELDGAFMWANVGRADDVEEYTDYIAEFPFTFNFHIADTEGNIRYVHTGKVPERNPDLDARLPAPNVRHEWREMSVGLGLDTHYENPEQGYFVQWNNAPCGEWRDPGDGEWGATHRVEIIDRFLRDRLGLDGERPAETATENLSIEDVEALLEDSATHEPLAHGTAPDLIRVARESDDSVVREMGEAMSRWRADDYRWADDDDDDVYDYAGLYVWETAHEALQSVVFGSVLEGLRDERAIVHVLRGDTEFEWVEDVDAALAEALDRAKAQLVEEFGHEDVSAWRREESETYFSPISATSGESIDRMNRGSWNHVVALGEGPEQAEGVLPPSNTGHITADEFAATQAGGSEPERLTDQLETFANFEYKHLPLEREDVEAVAVESKTMMTRRPPVDVDEPSLSRNVPVEALDEMLDEVDG